jgi:hypothetical protein
VLLVLINKNIKLDLVRKRKRLKARLFLGASL